MRGTIPYPYAYLNVAYKGPREKCPLPADAPPLNPVEYLVFQGLDFECARQDALRLTGTRDCQVVRCRVTNVGNIPGYGFRWQDSNTYRSPFFTWGIYLDDYTCGTTVFGNIIARTGRGGVMLHGGGDNLVENNIIVNAGAAQIEFQPMNPELGAFQHVYRGNGAVRNILVGGEDAAPARMVGRTQDMPEFANNLAWFGKPKPLKILGGTDRATVVANPLFEDPAHDDFRLRPDSPAWKLGFKPIPVERIGCYQSPERASWPIQPNYDRFREKPVLHAALDYKPAVH